MVSRTLIQCTRAPLAIVMLAVGFAGRHSASVEVGKEESATIRVAGGCPILVEDKGGGRTSTVDASVPHPSPVAKDGVHIEEPPPPQRVVTIAPNAAEIICALGACDRIVGVSKFCTHPSHLQGKPRVGGLFDPDLERIVSLRPDLVVLRGSSESVQRLCRHLGVRIYTDKTDTLPDIETCIVELGERLGREEQAAALLKEFQTHMRVIQRRVADRPRPRVLLTISRQPDKMTDILTSGKGTFLDQMLDVAGGVNAFGHLDMTYPQVSPESIIAQRPEVIIELMPEVRVTEVLKRQMRSRWSQMGSIPAVADGRIFFMTDDHCLIPSLRYVEIIEKVAQLLHPEARVDE